METVQLQCGHCQKVMAIGVEHLGGQVQCPHCKGIVQTPPKPEPPAPAATAEPILNQDLTQRDSIFSGAEDSDMAVGESVSPKVELPAPAVDSGGTLMGAGVAPANPSSADADAELPKFKPRPIYDRSVVSLIGLIFLVPYAILTTLFIVYLLFMQGSRTHPFDLMPDPMPDKGKGGPKHLQVMHNHPLAAHQKATLGQSIQIGKDGDLMVTPERVRLTDDGDLKLYLRAKNISRNTVFSPLSDFYVRSDSVSKGKPYSYLESKSRNVANIYNAFLEFRKSAKDGAGAGKDTLAPGDETVIVLTTGLEYRDPHVAKIAATSDTYLWRVQLRRGFTKWRGKEVSATAVIGVEFTTSQIERQKA